MSEEVILRLDNSANFGRVPRDLALRSLATTNNHLRSRPRLLIFKSQRNAGKEVSESHRIWSLAEIFSNEINRSTGTTVFTFPMALGK